MNESNLSPRLSARLIEVVEIYLKRSVQLDDLAQVLFGQENLAVFAFLRAMLCQCHGRLESLIFR